MNRVLKFLSLKRLIIQAAIGALIYYVYIVLNISLLYIAAAAILSGIIFGKVFCRWMCPIGFFMELIMAGRNKEDTMQHQFMYHKVGCPIAWVTGFLNKYSLFKIKRDESKCITCGKCDKVCYISVIDEKYSVYDYNKINAGESFKCSKCLECISECPVNALDYTASKRDKKI